MAASPASSPTEPAVAEGEPDKPEKTLSRRRRLIEDAGIIGLAIVVAIFVRAYIAQAYWIPSASMEPQLNINDRVVVSRLAYHLHAPNRGDIVVFKAPPGVEPLPQPASNVVQGALHDVGVALGFAQDQTVLIKRVIGLPGETLQGKNGHIYINSERLVEPYLPKGTYTSNFGPVTIQPGQLWVMGDNRNNSTDSRSFGPIPESSVVGRAIWKVWPAWETSFL